MNVTKKEIISLISKKTGVETVATEVVIEAFLAVVQETLLNGESIELRGFGTFKTVERKEKKARNPKKGLEVIVPARSVPVLKFTKEFKSKVSEVKSK